MQCALYTCTLNVHSQLMLLLTIEQVSVILFVVGLYRFNDSNNGDIQMGQYRPFLLSNSSSHHQLQPKRQSTWTTNQTCYLPVKIIIINIIIIIIIY